VSQLLRGRMAGFSTDRLIRLLNRLDQDVEIVGAAGSVDGAHRVE
jgi:predicted XRE-type DNA-binding protein